MRTVTTYTEPRTIGEIFQRENAEKAKAQQAEAEDRRTRLADALTWTIRDRQPQLAPWDVDILLADTLDMIDVKIGSDASSVGAVAPVSNKTDEESVKED
jgi:hypothetical protein